MPRFVITPDPAKRAEYPYIQFPVSRGPDALLLEADPKHISISILENTGKSRFRENLSPSLNTVGFETLLRSVRPPLQSPPIGPGPDSLVLPRMFARVRRSSSCPPAIAPSITRTSADMCVHFSEGKSRVLQGIKLKFRHRQSRREPHPLSLRKRPQNSMSQRVGANHQSLTICALLGT